MMKKFWNMCLTALCLLYQVPPAYAVVVSRVAAIKGKNVKKYLWMAF